MRSFERHRSVRVVRNDTRGIVARRTSCGHLSRIDERAGGIRACLRCRHNFDSGSIFLHGVRVELHAQMFWVELARKYLYPEEMPAIAGLDADIPEAHRVPVSRDVLLPLQQTGSHLAVPGGTLVVIRGQYDGYRKEKDVAKNSDVETFCALRLFIDSWRWQGVPWYLRSGKYLAENATEVLVELKPSPQSLFADSEPSTGRANYLRFRISPDSAIALAARVKIAGKDFIGEQRELYLSEERPGQEAPYERLLGAAMSGDGALFTRADFTYPLPPGLDDVHVAPLLCAGIIGFRSLRVAGTEHGERVGLLALEAPQVRRLRSCNPGTAKSML
jgi:hypothetical protein